MKNDNINNDKITIMTLQIITEMIARKTTNTV